MNIRHSPPDPLDRLLRAASRVPAPAAEPVSFVVESRVLAAWRRSREERWAVPLALWLRGGLAGAIAVALVAVAVSWSSVRPPAGDEYAVANATLYVAVAP